MAISEADALAMHAAIHGGKGSVTLASGEKLTVTTNKSKCRQVKTASGITAMEQNTSKASEWAKKAKSGTSITWYLGKVPWGRVVEGKVDSHGNAIAKGGGVSNKKRPAAVVGEPEDAPPGKAAKAVDGKAKSTANAKAKAEAKASSTSSSSGSAPSPSPGSRKASGTDPLGLAAVFAGQGHGAEWAKLLRPVIESQPGAANFIGPSRDKRIVPVRELTFQALKPNPPAGWKVVSFGQSPFPRIESATGIAHFDNAISKWEDSDFGRVVTVRCIIKAAAMGKFGVPKTISTQELRDLLKTKSCVGPAEWFQAMLAQGVLFMNAACTLLPPEDKSVRAGCVVEEHLKFWRPVVEAVTDAILSACRKEGRGVVFAWWGSESLKTKKVLDKSCFSKYPDVKVHHMEHKNPAAMADAFCDEPNIFKAINKALGKLGLGAIDWLPSAGWKGALGGGGGHLADKMGDFIAETQDLHKMYLERLKDGLDDRGEELADITGVMKQPLVSLAAACGPLKLEKPAKDSVAKASSMTKGKLTSEEAAAVHLYTTNHLYKMLNEALRSKDRGQVSCYFKYLRLLLTALRKLPVSTAKLYRGVALDLKSQYKAGTEVTWWAVSSCTPDLKVANSFGGGSKRTLFIITPRTSVGIRELSEYKHEEEFVLAPGTQFSVDKAETKGSLVEIHLKELDRPNRVR